MDRAETVRLLAEVFQAEGYSDRWRTLMDSIREHGPLHTPEWSICVDCGEEFDGESLNGSRMGRPVIRCKPCDGAWNADYQRRIYYERKPS